MRVATRTEGDDERSHAKSSSGRAFASQWASIRLSLSARAIFAMNAAIRFFTTCFSVDYDQRWTRRCVEKFNAVV